MRAERASFTAVFVATCRGLAPLLPESAQLSSDPYGLRVLGPGLDALVAAVARSPMRALAWGPLLPLLPWALYMQVRTRTLDDALRSFVASGGRQVVILGAGFDARAWRLREELGASTVYEVDHPATAALKRERFGEHPRVRALSWDFERDAMSELPERLAALGHDPTAPTFTLWEGVTMYLSPEAFAATLDAVRGYSAEGSRLAFNYVERQLVERPNLAARLVAGFVAAVGEPFKLGFAPETLREELSQRGFRVERDEGFDERARALLGAPWSRIVRAGRRIAVVERTATASISARTT